MQLRGGETHDREARGGVDEAAKSTWRNEMRNRLFMGRSSRKSRRPVRINSESCTQLVKKNAWKICWMNWAAPTSITTCHLVQSAM